MTAALSILVDADACPVKAEIYRVAQRYRLPVHVVSNAAMAVPQDPLFHRVVVDGGFDAADDWIAERADARSIVVTADILLAGRCLETGATVLGPTGRPFTKESIGMAIANRALMADLRAMGEVSGANRPMEGRDKSRFLEALDLAVNRLLKPRPAWPAPPR